LLSTDFRSIDGLAAGDCYLPDNGSLIAWDALVERQQRQEKGPSVADAGMRTIDPMLSFAALRRATAKQRQPTIANQRRQPKITLKQSPRR